MDAGGVRMYLPFSEVYRGIIEFVLLGSLNWKLLRTSLLCDRVARK